MTAQAKKVKNKYIKFINFYYNYDIKKVIIHYKIDCNKIIIFIDSYNYDVYLSIFHIKYYFQ